MIGVRVMLEYFHPWPNSAGLYLAREKGWYSDAGLDVELVVHDPWRGDTLDHLLGKAVHFGLFPQQPLVGASRFGPATARHCGDQPSRPGVDSNPYRFGYYPAP